MQETQGIKINSKVLDGRVYKAITKGCAINFDSKEIEIEECRYMQKVAELCFSDLNFMFAVIIFLMAFGGSFFLTFSYSNLPNAFLNATIGAVIVVLGAFVFIIGGRVYLRCRKFILDAEERILSENFKKPKIENVKIENEEKEDSDTEKRCPLSLNDWVMFLNNEINNLESGKHQKFNIFIIIVALFATATSAIVSWVLATASIANAPQNAIIKIPQNDIIHIIQ